MSELSGTPIRLEDIPPKATSARVSRYAKLVADFLESGNEGIEVNLNGTAAKSARSGLNAATKDKPVSVVQRGERVFLVRSK